MGNTAGKLSEKATRNPPGRTPEISYGHAILQPAIYNLSTDAWRGTEKQPEASGNSLGELHGEHRRETVGESHPKPAGKTVGNLIWTRHPPAHHLQFINSRPARP